MAAQEFWPVDHQVSPREKNLKALVYWAKATGEMSLKHNPTQNQITMYDKNHYNIVK